MMTMMTMAKKSKTKIEKLVIYRQDLYKELDSNNEDFEEKRKLIDAVNQDIMKLTRAKAKELAADVDEKTKSIIKNRENIEKKIKQLTETKKSVEQNVTNVKKEKLIIILLSHLKYKNVADVINVIKKYYKEEDIIILTKEVNTFIKKVKEQKTKKHSMYKWDGNKFLLTKNKEEKKCKNQD